MRNSIATHDVEETSATPLPGRPAAYQVGQSDPGQPEAPSIAVEAAKTATTREPERGNAIPEYRQPAHNLPDQISAREVYDDASNPDGCQQNWRRP
jgi:hypothetical protein